MTRTVDTIRHNKSNSGFAVMFTNGEMYAVVNQDKDEPTKATRIDTDPAEVVTDTAEIESIISDVEQYYNAKRNKENI